MAGSSLTVRGFRGRHVRRGCPAGHRGCRGSPWPEHRAGGAGPVGVGIGDSDRIGRSRQSVDQLVKAQRGPGGFPAPVSGNARNPLWRWAEVEAWFAAYEHREIDTERPAVTGAINGALEARRNLHAHPDPTLAAKLEALDQGLNGSPLRDPAQLRSCPEVGHDQGEDRGGGGVPGSVG
jgi:predicted DNA-binding transcriptional regulator AlpA